MHTALPTWLALAAAIIPSATAFYPYHYDGGSTSSSPSPRSQQLSRSSKETTARGVTLPLRRIATGLHSRQSNVYNIVNSKDPSQEKSVAIDQDGKDLSYMVAVTFGDSKEEYHMLLDSAASNTWVMSQDCKSEACKTHTLFGKGDSSTLKPDTKQFSITYGTGSSSGTLASDTIHIGTSLSSPLTFGLATNVSDEFRAYPMDGILGIGRGGASDGEIAAPQIMDVLSSNRLIAAKLYGIHLSRAKDGLQDGSLDIGHVDTTRFSGDMNYLDCVDNDAGFWEISLQGASVDGKDALASSSAAAAAAATANAGRTAIMDTGTSFILIPEPDAQAIHASVKDHVQSGETFFVPCDTKAQLSFSFNKVAYNISSQDWIGEKVEGQGGLCRSNIIGRQTFKANQWLVGDVFLKNVYSVFDFDKKRVGLGVKRGGEEGTVEEQSATSSAAQSSVSQTASGSAAAPTSTAVADNVPQGQQGSNAAAGHFSSSSALVSTVALAVVLLFM
ncbi:rhizopuspepsin-1 precursor [Bipolaris maydis]|nr:rhizopuspepsin-1 precursor [Bipolaris maydis]KAJ6201740.1 rhizopuspepsin-1 precursor [Bipolaris maydis]KAJ6284836.1 aspartic peptidase domain-containing protein [Bipolaris maydis]